MLQRRIDKENRVAAFPKTPKQGRVPSANFVTPAPKPRVALGAKSTNVHHRQFSSAKTGKRHSPVAPVVPESRAAPHAELQKLQGGAELRAALRQALSTGINVPDVEYAPPPVQELPYAEPEWIEPMNWDALDKVKHLLPQSPLPRICRPRVVVVDARDEPAPLFAFMEVAKPAVNPVSRRTGSAGVPRFAAPTAAARAKIKSPIKQDEARKARTTRLMAPSQGRATMTDVSRSAESSGGRQEEEEEEDTTTAVSLDIAWREMLEPGPLPLPEVDIDF